MRSFARLIVTIYSCHSEYREKPTPLTASLPRHLHFHHSKGVYELRISALTISHFVRIKEIKLHNNSYEVFRKGSSGREGIE